MMTLKRVSRTAAPASPEWSQSTNSTSDLRGLCPFGRILSLVLLCLVGAARAYGQTPPGYVPPLNTWSFDNTNNWTSDLGYAPLAFTNLSSSLLGDGPALVLDST